MKTSGWCSLHVMQNNKMKIRQIFILTTLILFSCASSKVIYDEVRKTNKNKNSPPGTIWLKDNLYIDITEISVIDYIEFQNYYIRKYKDDSKQYEKVIPKGSLITDYSLSYEDSIEINETGLIPKSIRNKIYLYFHNPVFYYYPIINITYEQAVEYCEWRTNVVNLKYYLDDNPKIKWHPDSTYDFPIKVKYRLPTKEEWEYAASAGLNSEKFPLGFEKYLDKNNKPKFFSKEFVNYNYDTTTIYKMENDFTNFGRNRNKNIRKQHRDLIIDYQPRTCIINFGEPNKFGLYEMNGNVSEMIDEKGIAAGFK